MNDGPWLPGACGTRRCAAMFARCLVLLLLAAPGPCQQDAAAPATPEEQLKQKLAQPFLARHDWTTDYDVAKARAAAGGKLVFGYFTTAGY